MEEKQLYSPNEVREMIESATYLIYGRRLRESLIEQKAPGSVIEMANALQSQVQEKYDSEVPSNVKKDLRPCNSPKDLVDFIKAKP
ncbi:MAG: hypothetical protein Q8N63_06305 [Nanoarchaeota archaeon]|nr:hypothetical protein [Nanoarchaeota archaeon]